MPNLTLNSTHVRPLAQCFHPYSTEDTEDSRFVVARQTFGLIFVPYCAVGRAYPSFLACMVGSCREEEEEENELASRRRRGKTIHRAWRKEGRAGQRHLWEKKGRQARLSAIGTTSLDSIFSTFFFFYSFPSCAVQLGFHSPRAALLRGENHVKKPSFHVYALNPTCSSREQGPCIRVGFL